MAEHDKDVCDMTQSSRPWVRTPHPTVTCPSCGGLAKQEGGSLPACGRCATSKADPMLESWQAFIAQIRQERDDAMKCACGATPWAFTPACHGCGRPRNITPSSTAA